MDLAGENVEVDTPQRPHAAVALLNAAQSQQDVAGHQYL
jgi:hypothetical protein